MSIPSEAASPRVVDAAIEAYVHWREECADVREAYRRWSGAGRGDRMLASGAYIAALDREEIAARVYAEAIRQLGAGCVDAPRAEPRRVVGGYPS